MQGDGTTKAATKAPKKKKSQSSSRSSSRSGSPTSEPSTSTKPKAKSKRRPAAEQEDLGVILRMPSPPEDTEVPVALANIYESAPIATVSDQVVPKVNSEPSQPARLSLAHLLKMDTFKLKGLLASTDESTALELFDLPDWKALLRFVINKKNVKHKSPLRPPRERRLKPSLRTLSPTGRGSSHTPQMG